MSEQLANFLDTLYWLRWIIAVVVIIALGLLYADALALARRERRARIAAQNDYLRLWARTRGPLRRPVVALPPRAGSGVRRG